MKHILTTILFFFCALAYAQNISVTDFRLDEMDLTANQQGTTVLDQNGEKCALIKVKTTQIGFSFDAGSLGVSKTLQKTAEIWVYVPHGVRKLSVSHQKFGSLDYSLPLTTQKAKTYIMELKAETPLPVNSQRLTIKCTPKNAVVMIDGEMADVQNGIGETVLPLGSHKYVAVANGYYQTEGTIELKADRPGKLTIELDPKETEQTNNPVASSQLEDSQPQQNTTKTKQKKSKESAYREAYERARERAKQKKEGTNMIVSRQLPQNYKVVFGEKLFKYNLICGTFSIETNAKAHAKRFIKEDYNPTVIYDGDKNLYRVVIASSDDYDVIVSMAENLRSAYPDVWIGTKQ